MVLIQNNARNYLYVGCIERKGLEQIQLEVTCKSCHKTFKIFVDPEGYKKWRTNTLIQKALPDLSVQERELLVSGLCSSCFDMLCDE